MGSTLSERVWRIKLDKGSALMRCRRSYRRQTMRGAHAAGQELDLFLELHILDFDGFHHARPELDRCTKMIRALECKATMPAQQMYTEWEA